MTSESLWQQGIAAHQNGQPEIARQCYEAALAAGTDNAAVPYNLGVLLVAAGDSQQALAAFATAARFDPGFKEAYYNIGTIARRIGEIELAIQALTEALLLDPSYHDARVNLSLAHFEAGDTEAALVTAHQALEERPDDPDAFANLGSFFRTLGAHDDARACLEAALRLNPGHADAWVSLGALAFDRQEYGAAVTCQRHAIANASDNAPAHWNLALALLAQGDFSNGWAEYEWRQRLPRMISHYPDLGLPRWTDEDLAGKTILLVAEQGHGDTLQFVRLAAPLKERGARVILVAQPALVRLLENCPYLDMVLPEGSLCPDADFTQLLMSLPLRLGISLDNIPNPPPYLEADPADIAVWRQILADIPDLGSRPRIGVVWAGASRPHDPDANRIDARRSLPFALLAPLLARREFAFFSLQTGEPGEQARGADNLIDLSKRFDDFATTAALVSQLDLVITVDTAVAHLAAGLNRPTWLLSRHDACWRWLGNHPTSPWYPSIRIFGQPTAGDWRSVIDQIADQLTQLSGNSGTIPA